MRSIYSGEARSPLFLGLFSAICFLGVSWLTMATATERTTDFFEKGMAASNIEEKIAWFSLAIVEDPEFAEAYYQRALAYFARSPLNYTFDEVFKSTEWDLVRFIEMRPQDPRGYCAYGELLHDSSAYGRPKALEEAIKQFSKAIEVDPKFADAYIGLASCYMDASCYEEEQKFAEALDALQRAEELTVDGEAKQLIIYMREKIYDKQKFLEKALSEYERAIAQRPESEDSVAMMCHSRRAAILKRMRIFEQALQGNTSALEIAEKLLFATSGYQTDPKDIYLLRKERAGLLYLLGRYEAALQDYLQLELPLMAYLCFERLGRPEGKKKDVLRIVEEFKKKYSEWTWFLLVCRFYEGLCGEDEVLSGAARANDFTPLLYFYIGEFYLATGDYKKGYTLLSTYLAAEDSAFANQRLMVEEELRRLKRQE